MLMKTCERRSSLFAPTFFDLSNAFLLRIKNVLLDYYREKN